MWSTGRTRLTLLMLLGSAILAGACVGERSPHESGIGQAAFRSQAAIVMGLIAKGDLRAFSRYASSGGIQVVKRYVDWQKTGVMLHDRPTPGTTPDARRATLYLDGVEPLVWEEWEADFGRSDLSGGAFRSVFGQFRGFMSASRRDFQGETYGLDRWDHWHVRRLGPVAEGKLVSNVFWYVYFVRESRGWRVWKLEHVTH